MEINPEEIVKVVSRYMFKNNSLHFQIIVQLKNKQTVLVGDFEDYSLYKRNLSEWSKPLVNC